MSSEEIKVVGEIKKRGRKPNKLKEGGDLIKKNSKTKTKTKTIASLSNNDNSNTSLGDDCKNDSVFTNNSEVSTVVHDKNLILHLNVNNSINPETEFKIRDVGVYEQSFFNYDPNLNEPSAYDEIDDDKFTSFPQIVDTKICDNNKSSLKQPKTIKEMFDIHSNKNIDESVKESSNDLEESSFKLNNLKNLEKHGKKTSLTTCVLKDLMINN